MIRSIASGALLRRVGFLRRDAVDMGRLYRTRTWYTIAATPSLYGHGRVGWRLSHRGDGVVGGQVGEGDHRAALHPVAAEDLRHEHRLAALGGQAQPQVPVLPAVDVLVVGSVPAEALPRRLADHRLGIDVVGPAQPIDIPGDRAADVSLVAEVFEDRVRGIDVGVVVQRVGQLAQAGRVDRVVGVHDHHQRGTGVLEAGVARRGQALVGILGDQGDRHRRDGRR